MGGGADNGGGNGDQLITYELSPQQVSYENIYALAPRKNCQAVFPVFHFDVLGQKGYIFFQLFTNFSNLEEK